MSSTVSSLSNALSAITAAALRQRWTNGADEKKPRLTLLGSAAKKQWISFANTIESPHQNKIFDVTM